MLAPTIVALSLALAAASCGDNAPPPIDADQREDGGWVPAQLSIDQTALAFGAVRVGAVGLPTTITITNVGGRPTGLLETAFSGIDPSSFPITSTTCSSELAPGASCQLAVAFAPKAMGARSASLIVSASPGGTLMTMLTGNGT